MVTNTFWGGGKGRGVDGDELAFPESRRRQKRTIMLSICSYDWCRLVKQRGRPEIAHRLYLMMIKKARQKRTEVKGAGGWEWCWRMNGEELWS